VVDWARVDVDQAIADRCDDSAHLGLASSCANLWGSAWRDRCTDVLETLIISGGRTVREHILEIIAHSEGIVDDNSERVLAALSGDPEAFLANSGGRGLNWLKGLVHPFPSAVHSLMDRIVSVAEAPRPDLQLHYYSSTSLVDISLTLQRIPGFSEPGLALFERLLALGVHSARHALDEVDLWPRHRRSV
jgi:hypothetical protein